MIKKYWKLFTGAILALFGAGVLYTHRDSITAFDIKENESKNIVDKKLKVYEEIDKESEKETVKLEEKKAVKKKRIYKKKRKVSDLEKAKNNVPHIDRTLAEAKANIIKKTERK